MSVVHALMHELRAHVQVGDRGSLYHKSGQALE
jgi:hypothetical protein